APILRIPNDSNPSLTELQLFITKLHRIDRSSRERYSSALSLHSNAIKATEPETQLINIWIALETLFLNKSNENKISKLVSCTLPFITISTLFYEKYELWDAVERNHIDSWKECTKAIKELEHMSNPDMLLCLISVKKFEMEMTNFLASLDHDPILKFKLFSKIKTNQNPTEIKEKINSIERRTTFDLNRIYRTRNQIVHAGYTSPNISEIIQRCH
ncbi:hypothetical protein, partial [Chromobacterium amazonense]|uniref:hypothetical protein n=1 Tax=Chromobacterium amazonense TaxID=1382803 RepID=UPI003F7989E0